MSSRTKPHPKPSEPRYVSWRGELIAKLALARAGLVVRETPPTPFDLLVSTPDGFYFLVEVDAYSSMHARHHPVRGRLGSQAQWSVEASLLRAARDVNVPVVLFVIDADSEAGHYARLDRLPPPGADLRPKLVTLPPDCDLSPPALARLVAELQQDWAVSRQPA